MINGAAVTLAGYVATEPYYRTTSNKKTPVVSMRVAWTSRFIDRETGEWRDGDTSFANVNCWRKLANNVAPSLRKGQAIVVMGRLRVREFDAKEGGRRIAVEIDADAIGHDLSRGVAHFQRTFKSPGEGSADGQPEGLATGEAIRAGLADEDAAGRDAPELSSAEPGGTAEPSDDVFNTEAIGELAAATEGETAAAVPF